MSFLFGGSKTETSVPDWVRKPIMDNVARATNVANMGYTPYYGPDLAAFSPMQNAAFDGTNQAAAAFGMPTATGNGMPAPQTFAGGIQGYSSAPMYEAALASLRMKDPARYNALMQMQSMAMQPQDAQPTTQSILQSLMARRGRTEEERDSDNARTGGTSGGRGYSGFASSGLSASLPGGVNTRNPSSGLNQTAGSLTSSNSRPTQSDRPAANPRR